MRDRDRGLFRAEQPSRSLSAEADSMTSSPIEQALTALRHGQLVIVADALDRENEGDLICAAETITPETVDFMLRTGRGWLCVPLTHEAADRLNLTHAVASDRNTAPHKTPFLIQIDHRDAGTGVSPASCAKTIRALSDPHSAASDFVQPGHVSPLLAKEGGVLRRAGHTEATVDLLKMVGMRPVGVLIEVCSQRHFGMASMAELEELAAEHQIPIISIEELIRYRRTREQLIHREVEVAIETKDFGKPTLIAYSVAHEDQEPLAFVW